jgi:phytoene dehydrogenase-like protein
MSEIEFDVVIVGAGHNALVAACYLGKAGLKVAILEATGDIGGASVSQKVFPDFQARLSRYSYLVSLLPDQIVSDLGLKFQTISRSVASFTPENKAGKDIGLLVSTGLVGASKSDFAKLTGSDSEFEAWQKFYADVERIAKVIAPTMLSKLPTRSELKAQVNHPIWEAIIERPLGEVIEAIFSDDLIRGVVFTDGLIGTFADAHSMQSNICFLYHLIGNGTGEWKVPKGGMGALVSELHEVASSVGVEIFTDSRVTKIERIDGSYVASTTNGQAFSSTFLLANFAPQALANIMRTRPPASLDGSQVKINMLLTKLPRLKSGVDPAQAFAGTFHFDERYSDLQKAFAQAMVGQIPDRIPAEMYCHTLSDPSILAPELSALGYQTLTLFGIHTPAALFDKDHDGVKKIILERLLSQLNEYLVDPIEECLAVAKDGSLCIEIKSPLELEKDIGLPRGNIFHKDLSMPFREDGTEPSWGVETQFPNLFLCGAGAIRGGGVSGIPGHNAAAAVLEQLKNQKSIPLSNKVVP